MMQASSANATLSHSLKILVEKNEIFKTRLKKNILFKFIEEGKLNEDQNRERFLSYLQVWASNFQRAMFLKTALCEDPSFVPIFAKHLKEEYGHDELLKNDRKTDDQKKDAILEALCSWFPAKMLSLNQYEKVIVMNLCLEGAANVFYSYAQKIIDPKHKLNYFKAHDEIDLDHEIMGLTLLNHLSREQHKRLLDVQELAWEMIEAMLKRIGELSVGQ